MQGDSPRSPQPPQALRDSTVACNFNNAIVFMWTVVLLLYFFGMLLLSSLPEHGSSASAERVSLGCEGQRLDKLGKSAWFDFHGKPLTTSIAALNIWSLLQCI
jgi:hypothetical protein